jgi:hypothetical protein
VGYKVQVAETVTEVLNLRTDAKLHRQCSHAARESDEQGACRMEAEQQAMGLEKPPVQRGCGICLRQRGKPAEGRELIGPAPNAAAPAATVSKAMFPGRVEQGAPPSGWAPNTQCSRLVRKATGKVSFRFEWDTATCASCPLRLKCIKAEHKHRTLVVGENHSVLQARRKEQQTDEFKARLKHRNAIEGTQSELVRAHGMRRARYRGLAKTKLQNYFIGAACNVKRWLRRVVWAIQKELSTMAANVAPATN